MTIREVRAYHLTSPDSPPDWRTTLGQIAVVIGTERGNVGYGVGGQAGVFLIHSIFREMLVGRELEPVEGILSCSIGRV